MRTPDDLVGVGAGVSFVGAFSSNPEPMRLDDLLIVAGLLVEVTLDCGWRALAADSAPAFIAAPRPPRR